MDDFFKKKLSLLLFFKIEGRQASAKAQGAVDHVASFPSSREEISQPGFEPPTSFLRFGYLSIIIREFKVISDQIWMNSQRHS